MSKNSQRLMLALIGISSMVSSQGIAEPLSFSTVIQLVRRNSVELAVQDANVDAARANAIAAGRLLDPKLAVGIENLPASGDDQWRINRDFMTMRKVGVMQEFPGYGKRQAQREAANAEVDKEQAERRIQLAINSRAAAAAWIDRYYIERRLAVLDEFDRENELLLSSVKAQLVAGKSKSADALLPQQVALELADRRDELRASLTKSQVQLRRWVGDAADQPLAGDVPAFNIDAEQLRTHVHAHPELAVYTPMLQVAQAELKEAQAEKHPDWEVEMFYAKRAPAYGDMVSLQFTVGLPLFSTHRQEPLIAAKRQMVKRVTAEREWMSREHAQELESNIADYQSLDSQYRRMKEVRIPLVAQKVELQLAAYQSGRTELAEVLAARRELLDERDKQLQLESMRSATIAKLYFNDEVLQ